MIKTCLCENWNATLLHSHVPLLCCRLTVVRVMSAPEKRVPNLHGPPPPRLQPKTDTKKQKNNFYSTQSAQKINNNGETSLTPHQCGFGTNPSTAKLRVAFGSATTIPSTSLAAMTWHPSLEVSRRPKARSNMSFSSSSGSGNKSYTAAKQGRTRRRGGACEGSAERFVSRIQRSGFRVEESGNGFGVAGSDFSVRESRFRV